MPQSLYSNYLKRLLDISLAVPALILLSPFLLLIAAAIKLTTPGPILFRQIRTGKRNTPFQILKFRTMKIGGESRGPRITANNDPRITALGRFLRRNKLDELPQLWNVLTGDMSLVGPRPELPYYVARYTPAEREILSIRPGLTGPDSLAYRNEEILLAESNDPARTYEQEILPEKLTLSLEYLNRITISNDLRILFATLASPFRIAKNPATHVQRASSESRRDPLAALLDRPPISLDLAKAKSLIQSRKIAVTGAAGSIGAALCKQIIELDPAILVCVDRDVPALHRLRQTLVSHPRDGKISYITSDVSDRNTAHHLAANKIEFIFHAAAHKHLPALESQVPEAILNNIFALESLLQSAEEANCRAFMLISSDKAVNPTSVLGATKRIGELMLASRPQNQMRCVTVRFGNVIGSSGSVVPIIEEQLRRGGPLTVTHPAAKRFFITSNEAIALALEAFAISQHGEILVPEMGAPMKIVDLARKLIQGSNRHGQKVEIMYTGLRSGEKIEEELFYAHEKVVPASGHKIFRAQGHVPDAAALHEGLETLRENLEKGEPATLRAALKSIVPEYNFPGTTQAQPQAGLFVPAILQATNDEAI